MTPKGNSPRFDDCMQGLHEYEDIRYPEGMMKPAAIVMRMQFANAPMPKDPVIPNSKAKEFNLEMSEIDALVKAICEAAEIKYIGQLIARYGEPGKTYLKKENAEAEHIFRST